MLLFTSSPPYNWTTDPTLMGWLAMTSVVLGIIGIIIGITAAYWFYRKGKATRRISYKIISDTSLVNLPAQTGKGKIKLTYENTSGHLKEINQASLVTLEIQNSGNTDLILWSTQDQDTGKTKDEEIPIEFEFENRAVIALTHVETGPSEIIVELELTSYLDTPPPTPSSIGLPHCLLKSEQFVRLGILVNGAGTTIRKKKGELFNGEIVSAEKEAEKLERRRLVMIMVMTVFSLSAFFILLIWDHSFFSSSIISGIISVIILSFGFSGMFSVIGSFIKRR